VYINNAWEMIGNTQIDLSNYALKNEIPTQISELNNDANFVTENAIIDSFDENEYYRYGSLVWKNNKLYTCISPSLITGAWNAENWAETNVVNYIDNETELLANHIDSVEAHAQYDVTNAYNHLS
jgi:hypothetical protein